jgi:hypothetical protein
MRYHTTHLFTLKGTLQGGLLSAERHSCRIRFLLPLLELDVLLPDFLQASLTFMQILEHQNSIVRCSLLQKVLMAVEVVSCAINRKIEQTMPHAVDDS